MFLLKESSWNYWGLQDCRQRNCWYCAGTAEKICRKTFFGPAGCPGYDTELQCGELQGTNDVFVILFLQNIKLQNAHFDEKYHKQNGKHSCLVLSHMLFFAAKLKYFAQLYVYKFYKLWVTFLFFNLYLCEFLQMCIEYSTYSWGYSSPRAKKMTAAFKTFTGVTKKNAV